MKLAPEAAAKAVIYAAVLLAVGASAARWLLVPRAAIEAGAEEARAIEGALARLTRVAAAAMLAAQAVRAIAHTAAAFGWSEALVWDQLSLIALESRWGSAWRLQVAAALFLLGASLFIRIHRSTGWLLTTAGAIESAVFMPLLGHAASSPLGIVLHAYHILGGGFWLGTLASILLVRRASALGLLRHFAPIAFTGASLAVASGAIAAVQYVDSPVNLWETAYGRALLVKLTLFAGVLCCGYLNWRGWSAPPQGPTVKHAVRLPAVEALLAAAIVLVTSVLTELAQP